MQILIAFCLAHPVWASILALLAAIQCGGMAWAYRLVSREMPETPWLWRWAYALAWPAVWLAENFFIVQ